MPSSTIQRINPATLTTPPWYSQVAVASGGSLIIVAGQVALDNQGQLVGLGNFSAQATQVFRNLTAALDAAGASPRHLIKLTTFVTDLSHLPVFRQVRNQFLDVEHQPASTLVQVSRLFRPEFLIEIEAMAYR